MKSIVICLLISTAVAFPGPRPAASPDPVAAIVAAIPAATRIVNTSWGYKIDTPTGTRNVYKTSTGYRVDGSATSPNLEIRKTATGYRIDNSLVRGAALGSK
jgi:hypothetical protein